PSQVPSVDASSTTRSSHASYVWLIMLSTARSTDSTEFRTGISTVTGGFTVRTWRRTLRAHAPTPRRPTPSHWPAPRPTPLGSGKRAGSDAATDAPRGTDPAPDTRSNAPRPDAGGSDGSARASRR